MGRMSSLAGLQGPVFYHIASLRCPSLCPCDLGCLGTGGLGDGAEVETMLQPPVGHTSEPRIMSGGSKDQRCRAPSRASRARQLASQQEMFESLLSIPLLPHPEVGWWGFLPTIILCLIFSARSKDTLRVASQAEG